jgi:hypothetical protein
MSLRTRIGLSVLWVVSLVVAGVLAHAQAAGQPAVPPQFPTIISGSDLGFRLDGKGNAHAGTLVIRVNGQWVEAEFAMGVKHITGR